MQKNVYENKPLKRDFIEKINESLTELQEEINAVVASANVNDVVQDLTALNNIDTSSLDNGYKVQVLSDSDYDGNSTLYKLDKNANPVWQYVGEYGTNTYTKEHIQQLLALKQPLIDIANKLNADLVEDASSEHKFVTNSEKQLITTNHNDILGIKNGSSINSFRDVEEALPFRQPKIDSNNKLSADLVNDQESINKFVTSSEKTQITKNAEDIEDLKSNREVNDIVQNKAELNSYPTSGLAEGWIVKVLDDESKQHMQTWYKWLNNNWDYIGGVGPYYTTTDINNLLLDKEDKSNKVTSISALSTDEEYCSAKCVYTLVGDIETLLSNI